MLGSLSTKSLDTTFNVDSLPVVLIARIVRRHQDWRGLVSRLCYRALHVCSVQLQDSMHEPV